MLEIFNNIIQYQYGGNPHLVYAIVRRKAVFESLDKLTLPTAIAHAKSVDDEPTTNGERIRDKQQQVPRFTPTQEWLARVKADLPLSTISRLLLHLGPQLDELVAQAEFALDELGETQEALQRMRRQVRNQRSTIDQLREQVAALDTAAQ